MSFSYTTVQQCWVLLQRTVCYVTSVCYQAVSVFVCTDVSIMTPVYVGPMPQYGFGKLCFTRNNLLNSCSSSRFSMKLKPTLRQTFFHKPSAWQGTVCRPSVCLCIMYHIHSRSVYLLYKSIRPDADLVTIWCSVPNMIKKSQYNTTENLLWVYFIDLY